MNCKFLCTQRKNANFKMNIKIIEKCCVSVSLQCNYLERNIFFAEDCLQFQFDHHSTERRCFLLATVVGISAFHKAQECRKKKCKYVIRSLQLHTMMLQAQANRPAHFSPAKTRNIFSSRCCYSVVCNFFPLPLYTTIQMQINFSSCAVRLLVTNCIYPHF